MPDKKQKRSSESSKSPADNTPADDNNWMSELSFEEDSAPDTDTPPATPGEVPDWLASLGPDYVRPETLGPARKSEPAADDSGLEWLNDVDAGNPAPLSAPTSDEATAEGGLPWVDSVEPPLEPADIPDWVAELQPTGERPAEAGESDDAEEVDAGFEWMNELADEEAESVGEGTALPAQPEPPASPPEAVKSTDEWLNEIDELSITVGDGETTEAATPDWLSEMETEDTAAVTTESVHAPAPNAPDWLNAMVPGVDLDYDVGTDEPIERDFIDAPGHRERVATTDEPTSSPREFEWLSDIVNQETGQPSAPLVPLAAAQSTTRQPRYVFSKPPAWLRTRESSPSAPAATVDWPQPDAPADVDDFNMPDWLK